ncbi:LacI family DNA-binding transcriptional regulator [Thermoleophilia bacterium SCSIO 60948]|nr:LacI family DNA-binding transcriptional regulator [Thermoleophilia bacterium SCSIO 60948]
MTERVSGRRVRPATLRDVAARAQVHVSTASRALNDGAKRRLSPETIERVKRAAAELSYVPDLVATGLRSGRTMTVGVVTADLENPLNAPLIRGLSEGLERDGFVTLVSETVESAERCERILRHLVQRRVDAIVDLAARHGDAEMLRTIVGDSVPLVLGVRDVPASGLAAAVHDDYGGGRIAAEHLLELGHRRVAQLRGPTDVDPFVRRANGFATTILAAGGEDASAGEEAWKLTVGEGERLTRATLERGTPTAIFAPSDQMAIGAVRALTEAGLSCPEDVSVVGYNDVAIGEYLTPSLTTVRLPSLELGESAAVLAVELMEGEQPRRIELPAELVVRGSTARPAA